MYLNQGSPNKLIIDYPCGPTSSDKCPYKRHTEENREREKEKPCERQVKERPREDRQGFK